MDCALHKHTLSNYPGRVFMRDTVLQYFMIIFFLIFIFCFTVQHHEQVYWHNQRVGELQQGNKNKKLKAEIS